MGVQSWIRGCGLPMSGGDDGDGNLSTSNPNYSFDIQIRAAEVDGLIDLNWNTDRTILKLTWAHRLVPANTYKLDLLTNQAHSHTGTEIAAKENVPLILGPAPGHSAPKFIVPDGSGREFTMPSSRYTTGGTPFNLRSGFTFTTQAADRTDQYPEVLWVRPTPGATNVPTDVYLELGFSQSMHEGSVLDSTLRITDVTGGDDGDDKPSTSDAGYYFDIQIGSAKDAGLVALDWNDDQTILQLSSSAHPLMAGNEYRLQMVVNKAKAAGEDVNSDGVLNDSDGVLQYGLPLILGKLGPLAIDLRNGFTFTTGAAGISRDQYPKVTAVTLGNQTYDATWPIPAGGAPRVPTDVTLVLEFSESMDPIEKTKK